MTLSQLETQIQSGIPTELYQIGPGQVVLFVPQDGLNGKMAMDAMTIIDSLSVLKKDEVKLIAVATDNESLIGCIAAQNKLGVIIGNQRSLGGFASRCYGADIDESIETEHPIVVHIDPADCPAKEQHNEPAQFTCPYMNGGVGGMEALVAEDRQPSKDKLQSQIGELLSKCEKYGYDIDVVGLKDRIKESYRQAQEYQLKLDLQYKTRRKGYCQSDVLSVCDIYIVGDGVEHKLDIRPGEKALYLTTILQGGFYLADISFSFLEDMASIFTRIPEHQEKEDGIKAQNQSTSGIGVMKMRIRNAIIDAIGSGPAVDEFAIEGYRGQEVSIRKATKAHIAQIKEYFDLK